MNTIAKPMDRMTIFKRLIAMEGLRDDACRGEARMGKGHR